MFPRTQRPHQGVRDELKIPQNLSFQHLMAARHVRYQHFFFLETSSVLIEIFPIFSIKKYKFGFFRGMRETRKPRNIFVSFGLAIKGSSELL